MFWYAFLSWNKYGFLCHKLHYCGIEERLMGYHIISISFEVGNIHVLGDKTPFKLELRQSPLLILHNHVDPPQLWETYERILLCVLFVHKAKTLNPNGALFEISDVI